MNTNQKFALTWCGVVVAIVIAIIGIFTPGGHAAVQDASQKAGNILDTFTGSFYRASHEFMLGSGSPVEGGALHTAGGVINCGTTLPPGRVSADFNPSTAVNPPGAIIAPAACNVFTGAASSTVIVIGPFTASSTITQTIVSGLASAATTTDLLIATSTTPAPATGTGTSTIAENVLGIASLAAGTQFYSAAGVTIGSSKGYTNPAGGPYRSNGAFDVGVGDYIIVFSTSTNPSSGGTGPAQVSVPQNITLKLEYQY